MRLDSQVFDNTNLLKFFSSMVMYERRKEMT